MIFSGAFDRVRSPTYPITMRRHGLRSLLPLLAAGLVALGTGLATAQQPDPDPVVVKIGDKLVRASTLKRALAGVPKFELNALGTTKLAVLKKYVDEAIVHEELLAEAARRKGALDDRMVTVQLRKVLAGALVRKELGAVTKEGITGAEIQAYYDAHLSEYQTPERVRLSHIILATKVEADTLLAKVLADPTREGWAKLAADNSLDPNTKRTGGDLGFVSADGRSSEPKVVVPLKLVTAAFALKDGDIGKEPVQSDAGWHLIWRRGHVPAMTRTVAMEEATIRELLFEQKQQATYKSLLDRLHGSNPLQLDDELVPIPSISVGPRPVPLGGK